MVLYGLGLQSHITTFNWRLNLCFLYVKHRQHHKAIPHTCCYHSVPNEHIANVRYTRVLKDSLPTTLFRTVPGLSTSSFPAPFLHKQLDTCSLCRASSFDPSKGTFSHFLKGWTFCELYQKHHQVHTACQAYSNCTKLYNCSFCNFTLHHFMLLIMSVLYFHSIPCLWTIDTQNDNSMSHSSDV